jgi:hypothetical protein
LSSYFRKFMKMIERENGRLPCIIAAMQSLTCIKLIARFVLVWFALSIGVAIASPLVKPQALELICSSSGVMKLQAQPDSDILKHTLDCPLCATNLAPPTPFVRLTAEPVQPLAYVMQSIPAAHIASLNAIPPPARGPPGLS